MTVQKLSDHYQALVDIGSNGIRFSISDLSPDRARMMPTIYQDRSDISLYDAQCSISSPGVLAARTIEEVVLALERFKTTCKDFRVHDDNINVVATEATRNARNRDDLLGQIEAATGWEVQLLTKEEEGRLGALGIASSVDHVEGICMDMGGGSIQLTSVVKRSNGELDIGPSVSLPYGAAALVSKIDQLGSRKEADLQKEISSGIAEVWERQLHIPKTLQETTVANDGFNLYLSGGGFRGYGHHLLTQDEIEPYPIPIINGYSVKAAKFFSQMDDPAIKATSHRISKRRKGQVPAVQLLIRALHQCGIPLRTMTFAQGGVREGLLYDSLPPQTRAQSCLVASTLPFAPQSAHALIGHFDEASIALVGRKVFLAAVNLLYEHASLPKDIRASTALRSTTSGLLAGAHGLSHYERAFLAVTLCERYDRKLPSIDAPFYDQIAKVIGTENLFVAMYAGCLLKGIADLYPTGIVHDNSAKVAVEADLGDWKTGASINMTIKVFAKDRGVEAQVEFWKKDLEKLSKNNRNSKLQVSVRKI
ncbi:hypothetical protein MMC21_001172 [Puttea exsequens]|nr:hypothetical protein [Puttea exsequens]